MDSLDWKLKVLDRRFGVLPLTALEKPGPIDDFKADLISAGISPDRRSQKTTDFIGGPPGDRTQDTVIKSHVLYH